MKHFTHEDWVDFVNEVAPAAAGLEMKRHLESRCSECQQALDVWQSFRDFVHKESAYEPPDHTVRLAIGTFAFYEPRRKASIVTEIANLVRDSFRTPLAAGVRGATASERSLLYQAGAILIDLSLAKGSDANHVMVCGQVIDSSVASLGIGELPVLLLNGQHAVAATRTNEFGEFQFECEGPRSFQISVGVSEYKDVFIPLDASIWRLGSGSRGHS